MRYVRWTVLLACVVVGLGSAPQQDVIRLENRMNQLEQRLFSIDTNIRNLEQQSRLASSNSRGVSPEDLVVLRSQIQALQLRLADDECALAKLDERTLSPAMRDARRKSGASSGDPCRTNLETPVRLPDRR